MLSQIQVRVYPTGGGLFWVECSLCGPIFLIAFDQIDAQSIDHLNSHGCQILVGDADLRPPPGNP